MTQRTSKKKPNFRSGYEERIWKNAKKKRKRIEYEPEDACLHYVIPKKYIPDFVLPNGIIVEAKGYFKPSDRTKMLRVKKENPDRDIRLLFQAPNNRLTKSKNSKQYWQWAEQHGFKWAEGEHIPLSWWKE